jgi:hypothetical protein
MPLLVLFDALYYALLEIQSRLRSATRLQNGSPWDGLSAAKLIVFLRTFTSIRVHLEKVC